MPEIPSGNGSAGRCVARSGRQRPEAEQDYAAAVGIQKQLAADFPNQPDLRNSVAGTCVNLALLHRQQKNWAEAKRLLVEGRPHLR